MTGIEYLMNDFGLFCIVLGGIWLFVSAGVVILMWFGEHVFHPLTSILDGFFAMTFVSTIFLVAFLTN